MTREHLAPAFAADVADVELALEHLVSLMASTDADQLAALEAVSRAASGLAARRRERPHDDECPVPMAGSWSLDNGMLPHIVRGENSM